MSRFTKMFMVAGLLFAGLIATSFVGASSAQAGGYGYGYAPYYHSYAPTYRVYRSYYSPSYHCVPSYGYGYGYGY